MCVTHESFGVTGGEDFFWTFEIFNAGYVLVATFFEDILRN